MTENCLWHGVLIVVLVDRQARRGTVRKDSKHRADRGRNRRGGCGCGSRNRRGHSRIVKKEHDYGLCQLRRERDEFEGRKGEADLRAIWQHGRD